MFNRKKPLKQIAMDLSEEEKCRRFLKDLEYEMYFNGVPIEIEKFNLKEFVYTYHIQGKLLRTEILDYQSKSYSEIIKEIKAKKKKMEEVIKTNSFPN